MEPLAPWRIIVQVIVVPVLLFACLRWPRTDRLLIALGIVGMTLYGMVQDQFSVRLAPEYFTIGHPPIEGLTNPTLLGIAWGFLGGWPGGLIMGLTVGLTATLGRNPPLDVREVLPGYGFLLLGITAGTLIAGGSAWYNGQLTSVRLGDPWTTAIPPERHLRFLVVACAHMGTYSSAVLGSLMLCLWVAWRRRWKQFRIAVAGTSIQGGPAGENHSG